MRLCRDGQPLQLDATSLQSAIADAGGKVLVLLHGLCMNDRLWSRKGHEHGAALAQELGFTPVYLHYNTGLHISENGRAFDALMQELVDAWPCPIDELVLLGHSMGGLLSRMQAIDSGNDISNAFFSCPVSEVPWITASYRAQLGRALVFKREPFVDRVIFIAVPHRGSDIADWAIVRLAVRLISLPLDATEFVAKALLEDQSKLNPMLLKYNLLGFRSVDMLSPEHPFVKAIEKRPIEVPFHSIIGDRGKGNSPSSSDGAVPYWSSHLEKAASEKIVPYGHSCTDKPETVEEIVHILHEHLKAK
jgi:pimeloyl-ACP methyl ester carboxylesterase